jgi:hypothetical protein
MKDVFYPGAFTAEEQDKIQQTKLWPLISGLHYKSDRQLQLTKAFGLDAQDLRFVLSVREGWPVAEVLTSLSVDWAGFKVRVFNDSAYHRATECTDTKNIPYILKSAERRMVAPTGKKIRSRKKQPLGATLHQRIGAFMGTTTPQTTVCKHIERVLREWAQAATPSVGLDSQPLSGLGIQFTRSTMRILLTSFILGRTKNDLSLAATTADEAAAINTCEAEVRKAYDKLSALEGSRDAARAEAVEMFPPDRGKWWVCFINGYGWVVGKLRGDKFADMIEHYIRVGRMDDVLPTHFTVLEPFCFYPTLRHMPQHHLQELLPKLLFAKVNREQYPGKRASADPDGFVCADDLVQTPIGAITSHYCDYSWIVVDVDS